MDHDPMSRLLTEAWQKKLLDDLMTPSPLARLVPPPPLVPWYRRPLNRLRRWWWKVVTLAHTYKEL